MTRPAATRTAGHRDDQRLHHVMVVGGTVAEWGELDDAAWAERLAVLGALSAEAGAQWLTLRPFERGPGADLARPVHHVVHLQDGCTVVVDPTPDGRERLVVALRKLAESNQLNEQAVASALLAPALTEPDLILVLGPDDQLPSSLVWELAYSELVYIAASWAELRAEHLGAAIDAFRQRHRRFGGLD